MEMKSEFLFRSSKIIRLFSIPEQVYEFKALDVLSNIEFQKDEQNRSIRKMVDICAVVQAAGDLNSIMIKSQGKDLSKVKSLVQIHFSIQLLARADPL